VVTGPSDQDPTPTVRMSRSGSSRIFHDEGIVAGRSDSITRVADQMAARRPRGVFARDPAPNGRLLEGSMFQGRWLVVVVDRLRELLRNQPAEEAGFRNAMMLPSEVE
jgi:hypothetical protein